MWGKKMSVKSPFKGQNEKAFSEFAESVKDFIVNFLEEQGSGKKKIKNILASWQSDENREKLVEMVKLRAPVFEAPKPRQAKKTKNPDQPKRPLSGFFLFSNAERPKLKEANPDMKMTEIAKKLGELWATLKDKKKQPYLDAAAESKKKYEAEMIEFKPVDSDKPKGARNAFIFFCQEKREEVKTSNPDMKSKEIVSELGRLWKDDYADEASRKKWVKLAKKDKERFDAEKAAWIVEHPEEAKVPKSKGKKTVENKPKKPLKTGYLIFCSEMRAQVKQNLGDDAKPADIMRELAYRWSNLGDKEKSRYNRKSKSIEQDDGDENEEKEVREEEEDDDDEPAPKKSRGKKSAPQVSGMVRFMQQTRPEIEAENPDWNAAEIVEEMKRQWSALSATERKQYD